MLGTVCSGTVFGISAFIVGVEVDVSDGLPGFSMVGSLGTEVKESRERVCVALRNSGINLPASKITVNLSPADIKKDGTAFDLPIAVGLLLSFEYFSTNCIQDVLFLGELGLNGEIRKVKGTLPIIKKAREEGIKECIVPLENALEGSVIPGITVRGAGNIKDVLNFIMADKNRREDILPPVIFDLDAYFNSAIHADNVDFNDVSGQESAKRAALIAASGFHNMLMVGPPGAGKSMIARRIPGILPALSIDESLEVSTIRSVAGKLCEDEPLVKTRPFISPHHTVTMQAMIGGGNRVPKPGLVSMAHKGVLFLDELPEFTRMTLDALRQPLEDKEVLISRVNGNIVYPSDFMLVCAMNPCPCGYYPDRNKCKCSDTVVNRYMSKVSGPILDRIDLCVELQSVDIGNIQSELKGESSDMMRDKITNARIRQSIRFKDMDISFNGEMTKTDIDKFCILNEKCSELMKQIYTTYGLSARGYHRILKVARTIADLEDSDCIEEQHLLEAVMYRPNIYF